MAKQVKRKPPTKAKPKAKTKSKQVKEQSAISRMMYSDEIADRICELISSSEFGLRRIVLKHADLPAVSTIMKWLADGEHSYFVEQYTRAREFQADFLVDQAFEIIDDTSKNDVEFTGTNHVRRDIERVGLRKWKAARLAPKKYGDNLNLTNDGEKFEPVQIVLPHNQR